jgi:hypothetical protein
MNNQAIYATIEQVNDNQWSVNYVDVDNSGTDIVESMTTP